MAKMTIEGVTYEGTPAELAEMVREFTTVGAEIKGATEDTTLKVGDKVRLLSGGGERRLHGFTNGEVYEVIDPNHEDDWVKIDGGISGYAKRHQLERVTDSPTLTAKVDELDSRVTALEKGDKPAYKTEKRAAKVGERILITKKVGFTMKDMTVGYTYEVIELGDETSYVEVFDDKGDQASALTEGYEVIDEDKPAQEIEHNGETYTLVSRKAQAGDVVFVTKDAENTSRVPNNAQYLVDDDVRINGYKVYTNFHDRTEANVLVYAPKAPALKVGDYVRVKDGAESRHGDIGAGTIVKVTEFGHYSSRKVRVNLLDDSDYDYFNADDLELVTEDVVKFAKIGRKPGEFKKGDIVRVDDSPCAKPDGSIFEVQGLVSMGRVFCDESYVYNADKGHIELVTPVESRVDNVGAGAFD